MPTLAGRGSQRCAFSRVRRAACRNRAHPATSESASGRGWLRTATYGAIKIRGARENNLKDVSLDIPKRKITVFTGVSGSGKSSLVFGTIAAESQRLINETYPAFVQQFMPHYGQPDADELENISCAIIVDQQRLGGNSRSTVATVTDAAQMLRVSFRARPSHGCRRPGSIPTTTRAACAPIARASARSRRWT